MAKVRKNPEPPKKFGKNFAENLQIYQKSPIFAGMIVISRKPELRYNEPCHNCRYYIKPENEHERWACSFPGICCSPDGWKKAYSPLPLL